MTTKETEIILEALEKCRENIERIFDKVIDDLKVIEINKRSDGEELAKDNYLDR